MEKLTFKQYLESKSMLLNAVNNVPRASVVYEVTKYCSIPIGESDEDKVLVGLKPKNKIVVEWTYSNPASPTPESIRLIGTTSVLDDEKSLPFWNGDKLTKWLGRHTQPGDAK